MTALILAAFLASPAVAQPRLNVMETLTNALAGDRAYDDAERTKLLEAIRVRFADYGLQVVDDRRKASISVLLSVITEGSFDEAPPERVADVSFAAYQALSRGAPPEEVEGIALYGYRKKIPGDTIAAWANGYRDLVENKVPGPVAADLVNLAMTRDLSVSDFDSLKWSLVDGVKSGYDAKDYAIFLFGGMVQGKSGPGTLAGEAKAEFQRARAEKRKPRLPHYVGVFNAPPPPAPSEPPASAAPSMSALWPGLDATSRSYLGTPYVWGGVSHGGIDCSGLTSNTYDENRVKIPRVSRDQYRVGSSVSDAALRDGDLVFFNTMGAGVSHVGMIVDARNRRFIQSSSSKGVTISDLDGKYYKTRYLGARRVVP